MLARGVARVEPGANPDMLVAYHASFDENIEIIGAFVGGGPSVSAKTVGGWRGLNRFWSGR